MKNEECRIPHGALCLAELEDCLGGGEAGVAVGVFEKAGQDGLESGRPGRV
jgi:hypothetical protein